MCEGTTVLTPEEAERVIAYLCVGLSREYYSTFPEDIFLDAVETVRNNDDSNCIKFINVEISD